MEPNGGAQSYLRTKILTASPQQLRLMLYDGAIKFCRQATDAIAANDIEGKFNALMRAQKIVLELSTSLNHDVAPELCGKLGALYTYIYRLLVDANVNGQAQPIDEAIELLEYEKETWQMLMQRLASEDTSQDDAGGDTQAQQTAISSFSAKG